VRSGKRRGEKGGGYENIALARRLDDVASRLLIIGAGEAPEEIREKGKNATSEKGGQRQDRKSGKTLKSSLRDAMGVEGN